MRTFSVISALLLVACGEGPDYTTGLGIEVYLEPGATRYSSEDIDATTSHLLGALGPVPTAGLGVTFHPEPFPCHGHDAVSGCAHSHDYVEVASIDRCLGFTSWLHELTHIWADINLNEWNNDHTGRHWEVILPWANTLARTQVCDWSPADGDGQKAVRESLKKEFQTCTHGKY